MTMTQRAPRVSDQTLNRLLKGGIVVLALLLVVFGVVYYFGQRVDAGPSMAERQLTAAEDAVRTTPKNLQARLALALTYRQQSRNEDALAQYDEIVRVDKTNMLALIGRAQTQLDLGNLDAAGKDLTTVIGAQKGQEFAPVDKRVGEAHYYLAVVKQRQGDLAAARNEATAALKVSATDSDALYLLGTIAAAQGKPEEAIASFTRALMFVPTGWCEPYQGLQDAYTKVGKPEAAAYAGGMVAFCQGKAEEATAALTALTSGPAASKAMAGLGMVAETENNKKAAIEWYQKALLSDPADANALQGLSRLGGDLPTPTKTAAK